VGAAEEWAEALATWAIPPEIMAAAPEDPWALPVGHFVRALHAQPEDSPSVRRALEALPSGGGVLDVGCGAGAASLPLASRAGLIVGVDQSAEMLAAFGEQAAGRGVRHETVHGLWPEASSDVSAADVVVCNHVLYNIPDLESFVAALADHSRRRLVVEITAEHPRAWEGVYWRALHGLERPTRPTAVDAVAVLAELGFGAQVERWPRPMPVAGLPLEELVQIVRHDLCLTADRDPDVERALRDHPPPAERDLVTIWWDAP
jgi:SAM-dependent methyltransferase